MKQLFFSKESGRNKKNMTHTHYAWEQFQKLDFITFYLNETFVFFFNRKKKIEIKAHSLAEKNNED